jgi:hypothetical protein
MYLMVAPQVHDKIMLAIELLGTEAALHYTGAVLGLDVVEHTALVRVGEATSWAHELVVAQHHQHLQQVAFNKQEYFSLILKLC